MSFIYFSVWACLIAIVFVDVFLVFKFFEYVYCANIRHQPPMVASNSCLRQLVVEQITTYYAGAKNICEIGSGFGGMARMVARNTNAKVYALENMPWSAFISKISDIFCKNNRTIWCDAFKYLENTNIKFDVAIAYLGPKLTPNLKRFKNKIGVLISLDFEIKGIVPVRVINMGYGNTIYNGKKYPHKLFVYEFK